MRTTGQLLAPLAAGAVVVGLAGVLGGCATIADAAQKQHEEVFDSYRTAQQDWRGPSLPAWVPQDATRIRALSTDNGSDVMVRVDSTDSLPAQCASADRKNLPYTTRDWAPDAAELPDRVTRCGDWEIVSTDDGYYAWFHAAAAGDLPRG
ncbi:MAG: hypothetical protein HY996_01420 [Micrococcales bacterium]|nr:hypothetical protein [Micrococcales bacterium]